MNAEGQSYCYSCSTSFSRPGFYLTGAPCTATSDIGRAPCPPGTASDSYAFISSCPSCTTGKYSTGTGYYYCQTCASGSYSSSTTSSVCVTCAAGSYMILSNSQCQQCSAGAYTSAPSRTVCTACADNAYNAAPGARAKQWPPA